MFNRVFHVWLYPAMLHSLVLSTFASLIAPFGGFFASGFKRAFGVKVRVVHVTTTLYILLLLCDSAHTETAVHCAQHCRPLHLHTACSSVCTYIYDVQCAAFTVLSVTYVMLCFSINIHHTVHNSIVVFSKLLPKIAMCLCPVIGL